VSALDLATARTIADAARRFGAARSFRPLTVVVLDAGGHVTLAEREDGSSTMRVAIAEAKAAGAIALGIGSRALMARAQEQPYFVAAVASATGRAIVPVPGGVLIRDAEGAVIGAVGVSGDTSDHDEAAAVSGVEATGLVADPG